MGAALQLPAAMFAVTAIGRRGGRRALVYQGRTQEDLVPADVCSAIPGRGFLLWGEPGAWRRYDGAGVVPWPPDVPLPDEIRRRGTRTTMPVPGLPCEKRLHRAGPAHLEILRQPLAPAQGGLFERTPTERIFVSALGWALQQFEGTELEVFRLDHAHGEVVFVPDQPVELLAAPPEPARARAQPKTEPVPPALPPQPAPVPAWREFRCPVESIEFFDGHVLLPVETPPLRFESPLAVRAMTAVRTEIAREVPDGVLVRVSPHGAVEVQGLEELQRLFEAKERSRIQTLQNERFRRVRETPGWRPVDELEDDVRGVGIVLADDEAVLGLPQLGLSRRAEALRRIYRLRERGTKTLHWRGEALLVTVAHPDGGPPCRVWEVTEEGNATYVFRPDAPQLAELMNWLGQPAPPRVRLLQDAELRGRVGFVGRVLHKDGEHSLDGWWLQLRRLLGRG